MVHNTVIQLGYPPCFKGELQLMGLIASESLGQFLFSPQTQMLYVSFEQ